MTRIPKPTEKECIDALRKGGHSMDARQVAYRIYLERNEKSPEPSKYVDRLTVPVRKMLKALAERYEIDEFGMRRPVKYKYLSEEHKQQRDKDSKKRAEEEETVRGILTASSFTDEEIDDVMLGSRVRLGADELQKVFEAGRFLGKAEGK